jgi:tagatose 1,6-diphosphate aldolase
MIAAFPDTESLSDEYIKLLLLERNAGSDEGEPPTYRFAIVLVSSGEVVGGINLRVADTPEIALLRGNIGFTVWPQHRGHGYARRACRLVLDVARFCGMSVLWVTCDPDNVASRRTLESVGAQYVDTVPVPAGTRYYEEGSRFKHRYRIDLVI